MITRIASQEKTASWRQQLDEAITRPDELLRQLELEPSQIADMAGAHRLFRLKAPASYVGRMKKGDPSDPLLLQILPQARELDPQPAGYSTDPVGDLPASPLPGLIHKYHGRVLLIASPACAVHCRYCFRRQFPYEDALTSRDHWPAAVDYIAANDSIHEVILSGGDPLMLADRQLAQIAGELADIPHLHSLRIHTRLPVVIPARIDDALLGWLRKTPLQTIFVIHCNHPAEIDHELAAALKRLSEAGVRLFNQSVLLRGINDTAPILTQLSRRLFDCQVQPYYLHLLDKVEGAAHFDVDLARATAIHDALTARLPGYLAPQLVQDLPGQPAKRPPRG